MIRSLAIFLAVACSTLYGLDFDRYHTQEEIGAYLREVADENPTLAKFHILGESDEGREIAYLTLTKGSEALPAIYFNGTHHGNEWSSTEGILGLVDYLLAHRDEPDVSELLTRYVFYLQPLVNPDGHFHKTREEVHGKDPNRDYLYPGAAEGSKFKTKIIPLVRQLADSRKFVAAAAYHSGIEEVIWPWCYTGNASGDADRFHTLAKAAADAMGYSRYLQSYYDYATNGEFIDYLYMTQGTYALTFEVSQALTPPASQLDFVVKRSIDGALAFVRALAADRDGRLALARAPRFSLETTRNPLWELLGMRLE